MPLHDFQCARGHTFEFWEKPKDLQQFRLCHCGMLARKVFLAPPLIANDLPGYISPATGAWIEGRVAREEDLRRSGCRPYEVGERQEFIRRKQAEEAQLDSAIEQTVDETISQMPVVKRDRLAAEMEAGVDAVVMRQLSNS